MAGGLLRRMALGMADWMTLGMADWMTPGLLGWLTNWLLGMPMPLSNVWHLLFSCSSSSAWYACRNASALSIMASEFWHMSQHSSPSSHLIRSTRPSISWSKSTLRQCAPLMNRSTLSWFPRFLSASVMMARWTTGCLLNRAWWFCNASCFPAPTTIMASLGCPSRPARPLSCP